MYVMPQSSFTSEWNKSIMGCLKREKNIAESPSLLDLFCVKFIYVSSRFRLTFEMPSCRKV